MAEQRAHAGGNGDGHADADGDGAPRRAVALRFDAARDAAPVVVAAGGAHTAERIVALALEHDVPLVEDPDLAALLAACDVGVAIPEELFEVVAQVLVFLYELNGEIGREGP